MPTHELHYVFRFLSYFSVACHAIKVVVILIYGFGRCRNNEIQSILYALQFTDEDYALGLRNLLFLFVLFRAMTLALLLMRSNPPEHRWKRVERVEKAIETIQPIKTFLPGMSNHFEFRIQQTKL